MAAAGDREKAKVRASILWDHYNQHGKLTIADVKTLLRQNWDSIYKTFEANEIEAPPVWDSWQEKTRRKAQLLTDEAAKLGQDHLTLDQASEALKTKKSRVSGVITQIRKRGFFCPEVIEDEIRRDEGGAAKEEPRFMMYGRVNAYHHPAGLQVLDSWPGPGEAETTYLLR
jgi:hypothetical protein